MRETQKAHTLYMDASPYYRAIVARHGRYLAPATVTAILRDHGVDDVQDLGDPYVALGELPAKTDAASLLAWLGY